MSQERTYTIQIKLNADVAGGAEAAAVLDDLQAKAGGAAIPIDDAARALSGMASVDVKPAKDGLASLGGAIDKLSREDSRGTVTGLTEAILGLASGNTAQGLSGVSRAMYYLTNAIPNPFVILGASLAIGALASVFKFLWQGSDDATESLNDFGETLDEEMDRLEKWAKSNLEWVGIKNGNQKLREDFDLVKSTAENAQKAIENLFNSRSTAEESDLRAKAKTAEEAGDEALAAQLTAAADLIEKKRELVQQNLRIIALEAEIAAQNERAVKAAENYQEKMRLSEQMQGRMENISQLVEARTGSPNAHTVDETRQAIINVLQAPIKTLEAQQATLSVQGGGTIPGQPWLDMPSVTAALEEARAFAEDLKNYEQIVADAKDASKTAKDAQAESNAAATKAADAQILANTQLKAWREELVRAAKDADPEVASQAAAQASEMAGAMADIIERAQGLSVQDIEGIAASVTDAVTAIDLVTTDVSEAISKLKGVFGEIYASDTGQDIQPLIDQARAFREVIDTLGTVEQQTSIGTVEDVIANLRQLRELRGELEDGASEVEQGAASAADAIRSATGQFGTALSQGGDELVRAAQSLDTKANIGLENMKASANALSSAMSYFSSTASSMLRQIEAVARMAAETERKTSFLERQIINNR